MKRQILIHARESPANPSFFIQNNRIFGANFLPPGSLSTPPQTATPSTFAATSQGISDALLLTKDANAILPGASEKGDDIEAEKREKETLSKRRSDGHVLSAAIL